MTMRVRFAPSPTGHVHIGNIRVAIFNWLLARHHGGKFLLRIEDTDRERSTPAAIKTLLDALDWLGLQYDEEAIYQSAMHGRHTQAAEELVARGYASCAGQGSPTVLHFDARLYDPAFVSAPRDEAVIDVSRGEFTANGRSLFHAVPSSKGEIFTTPYNWDALDQPVFVLGDGAEKQGARVLADVTDAGAGIDGMMVDVHGLVGGRVRQIRFQRRYVYFHDLVLGTLEKPLDSLRDQVIVRSDGSPVFHLANVVDDIGMGVTHACRGNDHVENTFRHLFLYQALGQKPPFFAHFPMIVNDQGKPYSKRDGDAYVGDFRSKGFLAETLFNFLALCGWSPGDDREIMSRDEMVKAFSLERVNKSAAQFNGEKLRWMNAQILRRKPLIDLVPMVRAELKAAEVDAGEISADWLGRLVEVHQEHITTLRELVEVTRYFFVESVTLEEKAVQKVLLKKGGAGLATLGALHELLQGLATWDERALEAAITGFAESRGLKMGDVAQPLRVAVTGGTVSRGIFEVLALLGREKTFARVARVLAEVRA